MLLCGTCSARRNQYSSQFQVPAGKIVKKVGEVSGNNNLQIILDRIL